MNIDRFDNPNLRIPSAIGIGLGLALIMGYWAGSGDREWIMRFTAVGILAVFILFFLRHMWGVGLLICFCSFYHIGFGFTLSELEMSLVVAGLFFVMTSWRKKKQDRPPILDGWNFGLVNAAMLLWLAYVFGHTIFNIYDPYRPSEYAAKNLLKTVEGWTGPILMMLYFGNRPQYIDVQKNFPRRVVWLLIVAVGLNIFIRIYQQVTGNNSVAPDINDPLAVDYFTIPILNLIENVNALRAITPMAMLFCGAIVVTRWFKEQRPNHRRLFYFVMLLSVIGAVLSGGRATLAFVLALFAIFLIVQRRIGLLVGLVAVAAVIIGAANMMPGVVKSSPPFVRRSINWALIEKDEDAEGSIHGSSDWRLRLFNRALDEWHSDPRIYWFGRATYSYGMEDVIAMSIDEDANLESALRRGSTHSMVTDLLVTFGLVGFTLYIGFYLVLLYFLWTLYRNRQLDELARTLTLVIFISLAFSLVYALIGGGTFPMMQAWFFIMLIAYLYGLQAQVERSTVSAKIEPPKGRRFIPPKAGGALPAQA